MEASGALLKAEEVPANTTSQPLLQVQNLSVRIFVDGTLEISPLKEVSFQVRSGEVVGVLGESGAGKTTLALALMGLLPSSEREVQGHIEFGGQPLLSLSERELRKVRGTSISLIHQDSAVLNPVLSVGRQLVEILRAHHRWPQRRYRERAIVLLEDVELRDVDRIYAAYPHQLSGGQRQRVVIAQALACQPALVIADEPTASLDPHTGAEILELLERLKQRFQTSFLLISHDLAPLARLADRIMVLYAGRIVEQGSREEILQHPLHPYTRALLECALPAKTSLSVCLRPIPTIPGSPEGLPDNPLCCDFEGRCPDRMAVCSVQIPEEVQESPTCKVRCFKYGGHAIC